MKFIPENIYHVYNQGNNNQAIFIENLHLADVNTILTSGLYLPSPETGSVVLFARLPLIICKLTNKLSCGGEDLGYWQLGDLSGQYLH